jgi:hypothetical protein
VSKKDKIFTLGEFDKATLARFQDGVLQGMFECHDVTSTAILRLRQSLDDVWAIEYGGVVTPDKKVYLEKLTFAIETLAALEEMFQGSYDTKFELLMKNAEPEDYEEDWHGSPT